MAENNDDLIISVSTDLASIRRSLKKLETDIAATSGNVVKKFDAMGKGIDNSMTTAMQARVNAMVGIGTKASKEWSGALTQQGAELDKLRAKYSPMFATVTSYKNSITEIRRAHALGAISSDEMTAAMTRERQASLQSIAAIKGRNTALAATPAVKGNGANQFNTANIAAQFQDIAVTSAMGMSPLQIALQQGTQLSAVLGPMGAAGAVKTLGAAFLSIINPVSLLTIGTVAATAAFLQYVGSASSGTKTVDEVLKGHDELIRNLRSAYGEAAVGVEQYSAASKAFLAYDTKQRVEEYKSTLVDSAKSLYDAINQVPKDTYAGATYTIGQVRGAMAQLDEGIRAGNPNVKQFLDQLISIENQDGTPAQIKEIVREIIASGKAGADVQGKLAQLSIVIGEVGASAQREVNRVASFTAAIRDLAGIAIPALNDLERAELAYNKAINSSSGREDKDDAYKALIAARNRLSAAQMPTPGEKPNRESEAPEKARGASKVERQVERDANAYRDLVKSADDRIQQMQLEMQMVGKTGIAADVYRMKLELLQKATDKGRTVSEEQRLEIEKLATEYGNAAEKVATLALQEELRFERSQMFKSPTEQRVSSQLRSSGLDENSASGQFLAGQIRLNEQLALSRDLAKDFASGFVNDLLSGVSAMDALANAAGRLGDKLLDMAMDQAINGLFGNLLGTLGGGLGGGIGSGSAQFAASGGIGLFASGGSVAGPGSGTSDSILARLSNGEFVVNAKAASQNRALLEAINSGGMPGFSTGGSVGVPQIASVAPIMPRIPDASSASAGSGGNMNVTIAVEVSGARGNQEIEDFVNQGVSKGIKRFTEAPHFSTIIGGAVAKAQKFRQIR